jgi:hypothetical protein
VALMCGPGPMVAAVADTLEDLGLPRDRIVYERFDYAGGHASRQDRRRRARFVAVGAGWRLPWPCSPRFRHEPGRPAERIRRGDQEGRVGERGQPPLMSILFSRARAVSDLGSVILRMPFVQDASTLSASASGGRRRLRWKVP